MLLEAIRNCTMLNIAQIIMSILSILSLYLTGKIDVKYLLYSNIVTLCNQFLWFGYCIYTAQYGLLPITISYFILSIYNIRKIRRETRKPSDPEHFLIAYIKSSIQFILVWFIVILIVAICVVCVVGVVCCICEVINKWVI